MDNNALLYAYFVCALLRRLVETDLLFLSATYFTDVVSIPTPVLVYKL